MLRAHEWTLHPDPLLPAGMVEDFVMVRESRGVFSAYYGRGPTLQDQRLYCRSASSPIGPMGDESPLPGERTHTRIYRDLPEHSPVGDWERRFITQVWPGLPKVGIWCHAARTFGTARSLIIPPEPGTLYSVAAANPCVRWDERNGEYDIIFEGRNEQLFWRLFHARWNPDVDDFARVDPEPIINGANPSFLKHDGRLYLYYSRLTPAGWPGGFETCVMWQEEP